MSTLLTIMHEGHRKAVRVSANDNMSTILQIAISSFGMGPEVGSMILTHRGMPVDLSQPFRFTGIPQNATLEMTARAVHGKGGQGISSPSAAGGGQVRVAMRLPGGARVQASFTSDTALMDMLEWWVQRGEIHAGVLQQGPSLQFMRTAYSAGELESTTLRSIGLTTGTAMFILSLSSSDALPVSVPAPSTEPSSTSSAAAAPSASGRSIGGGAGKESSSASDDSEREAADMARAMALSLAEANACATPPESASMGHESAVATIPVPGGEDASAAPAVTSASPSLAPMDEEVSSGGGEREVSGEDQVKVGSGHAAGVLQSGNTLGAALAPTEVAVPTPAQHADMAGAVASAQTMEVEANNSEPSEPVSAEPSLPPMGIGACRTALETMSSSHFDADSAACVITLVKMVDNIVHRPGDLKTRQIRCANSAFQQKVAGRAGVDHREVEQEILTFSLLIPTEEPALSDGNVHAEQVGRIAGGVAFLEALGFVSKPQEAPARILGAFGDGMGQIDRILVLSPGREDRSLLVGARGLLVQHASTLGIPPARMPQPPRLPPPPPPSGSSGPGMGFDPYKPFMTSTAPTPKKDSSEQQSLTEQRLQELMAKRANVEASSVPERNIKVTLPGQVSASVVTSLSTEDSVGSEGRPSGFGGGGAEAGDGGLIARKVARQIAERKKREDAPFQTKAMREIERLQRSTVYSNAVIKIQFPDKVVIQATFGSKEGVEDLIGLVRECLGASYRDREFQLYVSPPRTVLKEASSLSGAGLVPAALVYVSWKAVPPAGEVEGGYLRAELKSDSGGKASVPARPVGVALDPSQAAESKAGDAMGLQGGARGSTVGASGAGGKQKGKPSWLKIN